MFFLLNSVNIIKAFAEGETLSETVAADDKISVELNEPIGDIAFVESDTAIGFIVQYIRIIYTYGAATVGIICVLVITISGMQYAMDSNSAEEAKKRIVNSLSGLALLFMSAVFLYFINPNFFTAG